MLACVAYPTSAVWRAAAQLLQASEVSMLCSPQTSLAAAHDQRQPAVLGRADDDHLCVLGARELDGRLDALPPQRLLVDAFRHDLLEVCNALGLDALALGLLLLLLQLALNGAGQRHRQRDRAHWRVLDDD